MKNLILYIVKNLVKSPESAFVDCEKNGSVLTYIIKVNEEDKAIVIGQNGKTVSAIKNIVRGESGHQKFEIKVENNG